jgi:hypothetical protein
MQVGRKQKSIASGWAALAAILAQDAHVGFWVEVITSTMLVSFSRSVSSSVIVSFLLVLPLLFFWSCVPLHFLEQGCNLAQWCFKNIVFLFRLCMLLESRVNLYFLAIGTELNC